MLRAESSATPAFYFPTKRNDARSPRKQSVRYKYWLGMDRQHNFNTNFRSAEYFGLETTALYEFSNLYIYSLSVALQAITVISIGDIAEHRMLSFLKQSST